MTAAGASTTNGLFGEASGPTAAGTSAEDKLERGSPQDDESTAVSSSNEKGSRGGTRTLSDGSSSSNGTTISKRGAPASHGTGSTSQSGPSGSGGLSRSGSSGGGHGGLSHHQIFGTDAGSGMNGVPNGVRSGALNGPSGGRGVAASGPTYMSRGGVGHPAAMGGRTLGGQQDEDDLFELDPAEESSHEKTEKILHSYASWYRCCFGLCCCCTRLREWILLKASFSYSGSGRGAGKGSSTDGSGGVLPIDGCALPGGGSGARRSCIMQVLCCPFDAIALIVCCGRRRGRRASQTTVDELLDGKRKDSRGGMTKEQAIRARHLRRSWMIFARDCFCGSAIRILFSIIFFGTTSLVLAGGILLLTQRSNYHLQKHVEKAAEMLAGDEKTWTEKLESLMAFATTAAKSIETGGAVERNKNAERPDAASRNARAAEAAHAAASGDTDSASGVGLEGGLAGARVVHEAVEESVASSPDKTAQREALKKAREARKEREKQIQERDYRDAPGKSKRRLASELTAKPGVRVEDVEAEIKRAHEQEKYEIRYEDEGHNPLEEHLWWMNELARIGAAEAKKKKAPRQKRTRYQPPGGIRIRTKGQDIDAMNVVLRPTRTDDYLAAAGVSPR